MNLRRYRTVVINLVQLCFFALALWRPTQGIFFGIVIGMGLVTIYDWLAEIQMRRRKT